MRALRLPEVSKKVGLAKTQVYAQVARGVFPPPIKLTPKSSAWIESELDAVLAARAGGLSDAELKELVSKLERKRKAQAAELLRIA